MCVAFRLKSCPYCKKDCHADWVDVGVGYIQCAPYYCQNCHASEIGAYDKPRVLTAQEESIGWYAPDSEIGSSANVIDGKIVSHHEATRVYKEHFTNNELWHDKQYVDEWKANLRKAK